jgi:hypothetical protein
MDLASTAFGPLLRVTKADPTRAQLPARSRLADTAIFTEFNGSLRICPRSVPGKAQSPWSGISGWGHRPNFAAFNRYAGRKFVDSECGWFCLILVGAVAFAMPLVMNPGLWNRGLRLGLMLILTGIGIIALVCTVSQFDAVDGGPTGSPHTRGWIRCAKYSLRSAEGASTSSVSVRVLNAVADMSCKSFASNSSTRGNWTRATPSYTLSAKLLAWSEVAPAANAREITRSRIARWIPSTKAWAVLVIFSLIFNQNWSVRDRSN